MTQEALKLALEALYFLPALSPAQNELQDAAIEAIKEALAQPDPYKQGYADAMNWKVQNHLEHLNTAQPEQEPVAWIQPNHLQKARQAPFLCRVEPKQRDDFVPLYTAPPQRTWVGLTDEEMRLIDPDGFEDNLPQMIQQALKEKNT